MSNIKALQPRDRILYDAESVASIYRSVGPMVAERMINRAFQSLSEVMQIAKDHLESGNFLQLDRSLAEICSMADNLGLSSLSFVAQHARDNLQEGPRKAPLAAFEALWARLQRVADQSLTLQRQYYDLQS